MRAAGILFFCIALPVIAAEWGRLFYSPQERAAMSAASIPAQSVVHVLSAETVANGRLRRWVDTASQPAVPIPAHVRVGDEWQVQP